MKSLCSLSALALVLVLSAGLCAQEDEFKVKEEVINLNNPCGVAVQPETGHVFIADSGHRRVLRFKPGVPRDERVPQEVITGFPQDIYGKGPKYEIGPLGLAFLNQKTLVVGGGGKPDGEELLRIYDVPEVGEEIKADDMKHSLGPIGPSEQTAMGEGNFYGIAANSQGIYITTNGDDTKGWVARVLLEDNTPGKLELFIPTKVATEVDAPVGIAISPDGNLVVGQMGEISIPGDSLLTVYNIDDGKMIANYETGLHDIAAVAYSPSGKLYCLDFAWNTDKGGLYRLDMTEVDGEPGIEAVKIADFDKPSAMAFDTNGNLWVTAFGSPEEGAENKPGTLYRVTGDL